MSLKDRLNIKSKIKSEKMINNILQNDIFEKFLSDSNNILVCCPINVSTQMAIDFIGNNLPESFRIVAIGENINFQKKELLKFEPDTKNLSKDLIRTAINLNADKILLQDFTGVEAVDIFKLANAKIKNIITGVQASDAKSALLQAELNLFQSGITAPYELVKKILASLIDKIIILENFNDNCIISKVFEVKFGKNDYSISEINVPERKVKQEFQGFEQNTISKDINEVIGKTLPEPKTAKNSPKNLLARKLKRHKIDI